MAAKKRIHLMTNNKKKPFSFSRRLEGIEKTLIRRIYDLADSSCINLGLGELRFPTPAPLLDWVRDNIGRWPLGYTPNEGLAELRKLIAEKHGDPAAAGRVCVTVGAEEAIFASLMILVDAGDEVLIPDPGFPAYASITRLAGGKPKTYPTFAEHGFRIRADDVLGRITPKTKAVILNSPNNPTGAVYSGPELKKLADGLKDRPVIILSDEVYQESWYETPPESIARYTDRCIIINSFSKSFCMTGWRIGWCLLPAELVKPMAAFHQLAVSCAPAVSQFTAIRALEGAADAEARSNLQELRRRRDLAMAFLEKYTDLGCTRPGGTFYLFVNVAHKKRRFGSSLDIALNLLSKEKVITIAGEAFGPAGEGYLRLSFAAPPDQLEEGIRRIGRFLS